MIHSNRIICPICHKARYVKAHDFYYHKNLSVSTVHCPECKVDIIREIRVTIIPTFGVKVI